jgi:hypothetical protein
MPTFEIEDAICVKSTGRAILVEAPNFDELEWIPQNQIVNKYDFYEEGTSGTLIITEWLARERGWI